MITRNINKDNEPILFAGSNSLLTNTPETVAQVVVNRLRLSATEWVFDLSKGVDIPLGRVSSSAVETVVKHIILGTEGVTNILEFTSTIDTNKRTITIECIIDTLYGTVHMGVIV